MTDSNFDDVGSILAEEGIFLFVAASRPALGLGHILSSGNRWWGVWIVKLSTHLSLKMRVALYTLPLTSSWHGAYRVWQILKRKSIEISTGDCLQNFLEIT